MKVKQNQLVTGTGAFPHTSHMQIAVKPTSKGQVKRRNSHFVIQFHLLYIYLFSLKLPLGLEVWASWLFEVDSDARTIDLVKRNVAHARLQGGRDCCDVMSLAFLADLFFGLPGWEEVDFVFFLWNRQKRTAFFQTNGSKDRSVSHFLFWMNHCWWSSLQSSWG